MNKAGIWIARIAVAQSLIFAGICIGLGAWVMAAMHVCVALWAGLAQAGR